MSTDPGDSLSDSVSHAILAGGDRPLDPGSPEDQLEIVARAAEAHDRTRELLAHSVGAAKAGGHSWAAIGSTLGLSRQAAQQRFGRVEDEELGAEHRWLGPVTAFDEMAELELAGRMGWHTVGAGLLRHKMVRTATRWEHRRVVWLRPASQYAVDGWRIGCRAFPWLYLIRDLGLPPEIEPGPMEPPGPAD